MQCSSIFLYMSKCLCVMQLCWWRWSRILCHFWRFLGNQCVFFNCMCFLYTFSQSLAMHRHKWAQVSWWPFQPPMLEMINTKNGRAKMHAKLLCWMDQWPIELKGCTKHAEFRHKEHMEYDGMSGGVVNQDGKHRWYLMMQSMIKL
jgi:hypothetical protein